MPYGGNDWLALTEEASLEPEIPICDPHHHFWDFRTERIPYQRYLLHELAADLNCGHNVRSTVFIEASAMYRPDGPAEKRPVGEVEFVQGLAAASASTLYGPSRPLQRIIGRANLNLGDRVEPVLEALACGQPQPVSRDPSHGDLGPASRNREPGKPRGTGQLPNIVRGAVCSPEWVFPRHLAVLPAIAGARRLR